MNGIEDLPSKEREACIELKKRVSSEINNKELREDVNFYLRFLRAREFNLDLSETMIRNHIAWRTATQVDTILTFYEPEEVIMKYFGFKRIGHDKDGAPVCYSDFGNVDFKGISKSIKKSAIMKSATWIFEENVLDLKKQSEKLGKNIQQWIYIFDFDNYSFAKATHKPTLEIVFQLFQTYDGNYPERLKTAYIINASTNFTMLFSVVKPLLSGNTVKKVRIYGKDGYKENLLKAIDADVLPAFLGGTRTDPDGNPQCLTIIKKGMEVPKHYYMSKNIHNLKDQPGVKKLVVSHRSKMPVELTVREAGLFIEWEFETEKKDIGFALFYKQSSVNESEYVQLIPLNKINTEYQTETGLFQCEKPGVYILMFDNSSSWMNEKEVYVKARVVKLNDLSEAKKKLNDD